MNNRITETKNRLIYILNIACHDVYNYDDCRNDLTEQERRIADDLDMRYYDFNKDSSVQLQMLIYLNTNIFKRDSTMKRVIKAFINYNSANPSYFCIPSDWYVKKVAA